MTIERPMFPPVDPTRRRFLSHAAGVAAGGGVLAMTGIAPAIGAPVPSPAAGPAPCGPDPIFAAIDLHRQAYAACVAVDGDIPDDLADRRDGAWHLVMQTRPTTPTGLAALTTWLREEAADLDQSGSMLFSNDLLTVAVTIDDSTRGMSGLAPWSPAAIGAAGDDPAFALIQQHKALAAAYDADPNLAPAPLLDCADRLFLFEATTTAGVIALLRYIARLEVWEMPRGLSEDLEIAIFKNMCEATAAALSQIGGAA
jgi:hypothetical protein